VEEAMTVLMCAHCGQRCGEASRDGNTIEIQMSRSAKGIRQSVSLIGRAVSPAPGAMALTCRRCDSVLELTAEASRRVGTARRLILVEAATHS
jgi:hypothetical protein